MRINKYRGRRSYDKKWIYGSLLIDNNGDFHILESNIIEKDGHHINIDSDSPMFFDNDTIGQFTGLHDKNGVEIYENDVIELIDRLVVVKWNEYLCAFDIEFLKFKENKDNDFVFNGVEMHELNQFEVIGNIHEESKNNDK